jgi:hypothetical protein
MHIDILLPFDRILAYFVDQIGLYALGSLIRAGCPVWYYVLHIVYFGFDDKRQTHHVINRMGIFIIVSALPISSRVSSVHGGHSGSTRKPNARRTINTNRSRTKNMTRISANIPHQDKGAPYRPFVPVQHPACESVCDQYVCIWNTHGALALAARNRHSPLGAPTDPCHMHPVGSKPAEFHSRVGSRLMRPPLLFASCQCQCPFPDEPIEIVGHRLSWSVMGCRIAWPSGPRSASIHTVELSSIGMECGLSSTHGEVKVGFPIRHAKTCHAFLPDQGLAGRGRRRHGKRAPRYRMSQHQP